MTKTRLALLVLVLIGCDAETALDDVENSEFPIAFVKTYTIVGNSNDATTVYQDVVLGYFAEGNVVDVGTCGIPGSSGGSSSSQPGAGNYLRLLNWSTGAQVAMAPPGTGAGCAGTRGARITYGPLAYPMALTLRMGCGNVYPCYGTVQLNVNDTNPTINNVTLAFNSVASSASYLAYNAVSTINPGQNMGPYGYNHFQGIGRKGNYLFLSGSVNADLFVAQLGSKASAPAEWGSNLPLQGQDQLLRRYSVYRSNPSWVHAGGLQIMGDYLALPIEASPAGSSEVAIISISNPNTSRWLYAVERYAGQCGSGNACQGAAAAGLTKLADGRYLLAVAGYDTETIDFYLSTNPINCDAFVWRSRWTHGVSPLYTEIGDTNWAAYQNINLIRQSDGAIFIAATHQQGYFNWSDLYRVAGFDGTAPSLTKVAKAEKSCNSSYCNFDGAAGFAIGSGELYLYSSTYGGVNLPSTLKFSEFGTP